LSHQRRLLHERLAIYAAMGRAAAAAALVPCALIFNECPDHEWVRRAIMAGFNLVLPTAAADDGGFVARLQEITALAHGHGVSVEAELGELPCGSGGAIDGERASLTDPERAARLVQDTGVDLLAVSVGNVHVRVEGEAGLDLDLLARIRCRVAVP